MSWRPLPPTVEGVPRYLVERAFSAGWDAGGDLGAFCWQILERNPDEVTWLHSYVSDDRKRLFCLYEAPSPEAIRRSAIRNELPVDSITSVRVLDPYHFRR
jgi:hypothetical protein